MSIRFALIKKELAVPLPIYLSGYFNRTEPATAIADPLNISCFYVEDNNKAVAVFGLDILGIYDGFYDPLVKAVLEKVQRPDLQVVFSSAHTHSAPGFDVLHNNNPLNRDIFFQEIINKACSILEEAPAIASPATLTYAAKAVSGVGANRRNKDVPVNTILRTLSFPFADKQAVVVNFNCHPTHLSAKNLLVTKDYQGAAMDELSKENYLPMFLQGACGDVSTRFTRKEQSFEDMHRIGSLFAQEIKSQSTLETMDIHDFGYCESYFELPKKQYQSEEFYLDKIEEFKTNLTTAEESMAPADLRILQTALEGIQVEYAYSKFQDKIVTSIRCGILTLGDKIAMVFLPFELFSKIGDMITDNSKYPCTMVIGYSFDGLGYMPDIASYEQSGYEILSCTYEKGCGELVGKEVLALLNK